MTPRLPTSLVELRGRRAASWIRESTTGQYERYGPDVQREQISRASARLGLEDTGLAWSPAHSGSTVHASPAMRTMVAAAVAGEFDVLVVARSDRWQRNLRQTLNLLEGELHPAGVVVWFDDEELLSSNDRAWDQLVDEAKGAESWLRKHRRRVKEGLAAQPVAADQPEADDALEYLASLGKLWTETSDAGRRALAVATFARLGAIGGRIVSVAPTPYAERRGLVLALPTSVTMVGGTGVGHTAVTVSWPIRILGREAWLRASRSA